ncbi:acyl-CoA dehydrogenase [Undibacterium sp.]|jgi:acyl-CoA dehydrogenase|uniref:acyl-CoA dehydrogenase n=1 Tax=Undibacterium sp. TaxID=1914977 RepID=UPI002C9E1D27|nr:acyl-CoA dehydrogenase [Undibacterium sp.]HTD05970.1 acyl-CoA dehydrogenase [Undibacterium sp.]
MIWWLGLLVAAFLALCSLQAAARFWLGAAVAWLIIGYLFDLIGGFGLAVWIILLLAPMAMIAIKPLRRALVTPAIFNIFKKILPAMSATERDALEAGTTWWDAELFSGKPQWNSLLELPQPKLNDEEQAFLDNEVDQLCDLVNDWESTQIWQDLPPEAWQFIKDRGFLGMIIPKRYGGKEFSAYMHSQVIMKIASRCSALAVSVMVPNSLGPAELLLHYGTEEQKDYYLPRLAKGVELPCFALTSPYAGSDAAAIPDIGIVCRANFNGEDTLGFRITWDKRYITLGPIASLLGLAFRASDPDRLLGGDADLGITCALIPTQHPGVVSGRRHWPLNAVFQNGPTSGANVFIPMEWVIGGQAQIGKGWRMLMECLAAGRAISLPSSNVGSSKFVVRSTSAYVAFRKQFHTPIGKFEGVQEALARMGGNLYMMDAVRKISALAIDSGEKPAVISAIAKYHVTERARMIVNNGMDIVGGKGICMGPNNFLARAYQQVPIAITVEGANILTRCLIIFGQGAIRCHPFVLKEMDAVMQPDKRKGLHDFDDAFFGHVSFVFANLARSIAYGLTGGHAAPAPPQADDEVVAYYQEVGRLSSVFALLTDAAMFVLGGSLKRRESISARLGDVLSQMYLISCTLKRYEDEGAQEEDLPYVHWSIQDALYQAQEALLGVLENFPNVFIAATLRFLAFPFGRPYRKPADALGMAVAEAMQVAGDSRDRLLADTFMSKVSADPGSYGEMALQLLPQVNRIEKRLKDAIQAGSLAPMPQSFIDMQQWIRDAAEKGVINGVEQSVLGEFASYGDSVVQVDDFPQDFGAEADMRHRQALEKRKAA